MIGKSLYVCLVGIALAIAAAVVVAILPRLNVLLLPQVFWFVVPVAGLCWKFLEWSRPRVGMTGTATLSGERALIVSLIAGAALGGLGVLESGTQLSLDGFPGASLSGASAGMRTTWSFVDLISGAVTEEVAVRGWIQFRLQPLIGLLYAQGVADLIFVALHGIRFTGPGGFNHALEEFVLVTSVGVVNGTLPSKSQSLIWPVVVHALSNGLIFVAAFGLAF
jgi:membrane protease YdiL (CAAX protease family)